MDKKEIERLNNLKEDAIAAQAQVYSKLTEAVEPYRDRIHKYIQKTYNRDANDWMANRFTVSSITNEGIWINCPLNYSMFIGWKDIDV